VGSLDLPGIGLRSCQIVIRALCAARKRYCSAFEFKPKSFGVVHGSDHHLEIQVKFGK
jgi:hypothetical protein